MSSLVIIMIFHGRCRFYYFMEQKSCNGNLLEFIAVLVTEQKRVRFGKSTNRRRVHAETSGTWDKPLSESPVPPLSTRLRKPRIFLGFIFPVRIGCGILFSAHEWTYCRILHTAESSTELLMPTSQHVLRDVWSQQWCRTFWLFNSRHNYSNSLGRHESLIAPSKTRTEPYCWGFFCTGTELRWRLVSLFQTRC